MHRFEQLHVWQRAQRMAIGIDAIASQLRCEYATQLRRSAASVPDNIAEGCGRGSDREFAHFVAIAMGSCAEAQTQLRRALTLTGNGEFIALIDEAQQIGWMLGGLRRRVLVGRDAG